MLDQFKHLTPQQIARLIQYAEAGDSEGQIDGAQLHAEKNAPWVNGPYSHLRFAPYEFKPYPKWLFNAQWTRADEQWRAARAKRVRKDEIDDWQVVIADAEKAREACMRYVETPEEEAALGPSWQETPGKAIEVQEQLDRAVAQAAAESAFDDRRMGAQAKAEREAADAASEGHLVEVAATPLPPKKKA